MSKIPLLTLGIVCLALSMMTIPAQAQYGTQSIGTFNKGNSTTCQTGGWYYYTDSNQMKHYMNCYEATVTGCPNDNTLGLTYGYLDPVGFISNLTVEKGVIVFHSGQDGTTPAGDSVGMTDGDFQFADYYFRQGYEVVQLAWDSAWEATQDSFPPPPPYGNIQYAACRPATFFNYIFNQLYLPIYQNNSTAGMCGHAFSAGSGAIAYSMAYYKPPDTPPGWWWDNVELLSGPQFSDIKQGCATGPGAATPVTVCGQNNNNQWGCRLGTDTTWTLPPEYVGASIGWVGGWTNDQTCINSLGTSSFSNQRWLAQSIVDDGTNSPVFSYPHTAMAGWVCRTLQGQYSQDACNQHYDQNYCPNNSSSQGEIFYAAVTANGAQPLNYNVYSVDLCNKAEGIAGGTVSYLSSESGFTAVKQDMAGGSGVTAQCSHTH
jgi:hypothetical protein